jgi:cytochrome d ubiquinol oxidase subunit I
MAANSWMQHPVGYQIDSSTGEAQLTDIWAVLTNPVFLWGYAHVLLAALTTAAMVMLSVSAWQLRKGREPAMFEHSARLSLIVLAPAIVLSMFVGGQLGIIETKYQPMKISAAEGQWDTCQPCSFSVFQIGGGNSDHTPTKIIEIPHLLSLLATGTWNGKVEGLDEVNAQYQSDYGSGDYVPNVFIQYWSMRVMAYGGSVVALFALWGLWVLRRRKLATAKWFQLVAIWAVVLPFAMNTAGWLLTESGRQPWIVQGVQLTKDGVSPSVGTGTVVTSLIVFALLYSILAVVDLVLMLKYSRRQLAPVEVDDEGVPEPAFTY